MQFHGDPCAIRDYIKKTTIQSINFYFRDAKERNTIDHRVCYSLLQQAYNSKIIKHNNEKKKLHKCAIQGVLDLRR